MQKRIIALRSVIAPQVALVGAITALCSGCGSSSSSTGANGGAGGEGGSTQVVPEVTEGTCKITSDTVDKCATEFLQEIGCQKDYDSLSSVPLTSSIPGAVSAKVVFDRTDTTQDNPIYFQNSNLYPIHYNFASTHLGHNQGYEDVGAIAVFNTSQYSAPDRRFMLGAVTYYEGPKAWTLELAPYDKATAEMTAQLYNAVKKAAWFGPALQFHPTSDSVTTMAKDLPSDILQISTAKLFEGIDYQPLNLGETYGQVHFIAKANVETDYVNFRDIAVLEAIPNDIAVTAGIITGEFQTPLSHVNVLARNRGTPNMGLRGAFTNAELKALDGKWIKLTVGAEKPSWVEVTKAEADAWWEANKPEGVTLPAINLDVTDFRDIAGVTVESDATPLVDSIKAATLAFGAKAANYSVLYNTPDMPIRNAFAIPIYYYHQFMQENGFYDQVTEMQKDTKFQNDAATRDADLAALREAMIAAPLNATFMQMVKDKAAAPEYAGLSLRFRTSTNAEDLAGFPCAGCYDSHTGDPNVSWEDVWHAIKDTWSGVWFYRTYMEREYHSIDHLTVGMALLVHHNFPNEQANGVAVTANIFEPTGLDPAYYVNVQYGGDAAVVAPPEGVTSDQFLYYYSSNEAVYLSTTSLSMPAGQEHVLSRTQAHDLSNALTAINDRYSEAYGPESGNQGWFAMDVEFKFTDEDSPGTPILQVKQARPYPAPSSVSSDATVCPAAATE